MSAKDRLLCGYTFLDDESYERAMKDREIIDYLKQNVNMSDSAKVLRLYQKSIEQDLFGSIVGLDFLKKLQEFLLSVEDIPNSEVIPIPQKLRTTEEKNEYEQNEQKTTKQKSQ